MGGAEKEKENNYAKKIGTSIQKFRPKFFWLFQLNSPFLIGPSTNFSPPYHHFLKPNKIAPQHS